METWRTVWRNGVMPQLSTAGLLALRQALVDDDDRLVQGATCVPAPPLCVLDWPCEAACAVGYAAWQGDGLATVGEVEEFFAKVCFASDQAVGEPAAVRYFLNWFDDTPRDLVRGQLLPEVERGLRARGVEVVAECGVVA